jgi:acetoin utilization deacetylase AcuC-like enzyme
VEVLCDDVRARGADALVVSLGLDAAAGDPESPLEVSAEGYRRAAEKVAALGPAVVVQEGGYDLTALGRLALVTLAGLAA